MFAVKFAIMILGPGQNYNIEFRPTKISTGAVPDRSVHAQQVFK